MTKNDDEREECGEDEKEKGRNETEEKSETRETTEPQEHLKEENEQLKKDLQRLQAEFENYQKRVEKENASSEDRGKRAVLLKLIGMADEFDAAVLHMHKSSEIELRNGIRLLQKKLASLLEEEGVREIECLGKKFDPDRCDAVEMVDGEGEAGVVAKEMRKGYVHNSKVLRHAMVAVTKEKKE